MSYTKYAYEFVNAFMRKNRESKGEVITVLKEDAPQWCYDLIYTLHDGRLPEDWTYNMASLAASNIADRAMSIFEEDEDADIVREHITDEIPEIADSLTDIYTHSLKKWTLEVGADQYIEEVMQELGPFDEYVQLLMAAQYRCIEWMLETINEAIAEQTEQDKE